MGALVSKELREVGVGDEPREHRLSRNLTVTLSVIEAAGCSKHGHVMIRVVSHKDD